MFKIDFQEIFSVTRFTIKKYGLKRFDADCLFLQTKVNKLSEAKTLQ